MRKLALLLALYDGSPYLPYLLPSLAKQTNRDWHLFAIDDCSKSLEEQARARKLIEESGLPHTFIENPFNMNFAVTQNRMAAMADAEYVQLINQDAVLAPDYIEKVLGYMESHPECASAAGTILRWDFDRRDEVDGGKTKVVDSLGLVKSWIGEVYDIGAGKVDVLGSGKVEEGKSGILNVLGVSGCLPMYRMSAVREASLDGSLFDGAFVFYKEDVDLALRLRALRYTSVVVCEALAWHRRTLKAGKAWYMKYWKGTSEANYFSWRNHAWLWKAFAGQPQWSWADVCRVPYSWLKLGYWLVRKPSFVRRYLVDNWQRRQHLLARRQLVRQLYRIGLMRPPRQEAKPLYDVAVVTVPFNRLDSLSSLQRARTASNLKTACVIVDNGSTAFDAYDRVTREVPDAHVVLRGGNYGFGASNNRGATEVEAKYYFLLNPDTELVDEVTLDKLLAFMEKNPQVGIVAPKLTYTDGRTQENIRRFPAWYMPVVQRTGLGNTAWGKRYAQSFMMADDAHERTRPVDWAQGSALFVRAEVFRRVGGFDDRYFLYYEDIDLCRQVWNLGYQVTYYPEVVIRHAYAKESAKVSGTIAGLLKNRVARWHVASAGKYILKWAFRRVPDADRVHHNYAS